MGRPRSRREVLTLCQPPGSTLPASIVEVTTTAKACIVRQRAVNVVAHGETREQIFVNTYSWWMERAASDADRVGGV